MDLPGLIASLVGGGAAASIVVVAMLRMSANAVAVAIEHRGKIEIEKYKSEFQTEMERERQAFARELESQRAEAARSLEEFRATMTLGAEVRRQLAIRKVDVIGQIIGKGDEIVRLIQFQAGSGYGEKMNLFGDYLRANKHLFAPLIAQKFEDFFTSVVLHHHHLAHANPGTVQQMIVATNELITTARGELHVEQL